MGLVAAEHLGVPSRLSDRGALGTVVLTRGFAAA